MFKCIYYSTYACRFYFPAIVMLPSSYIVVLCYYYIIIGQFFVYYLETIRFSPSSAGLVSSIYLLVGFLGGTLGGYHFSRTHHKIAMFVIINLMLSFLLISLGFVHNYIIIVFITIVLGMLTIYGFSVMYTFIRYISRRDLVSLSLSFNNSIQLAIAAIAPIIFTAIAYSYSYRASWIVTGIIPLAVGSQYGEPSPVKAGTRYALELCALYHTVNKYFLHPLHFLYRRESGRFSWLIQRRVREVFPL